MRFRPARRVVIVLTIWMFLCVAYIGGYFVRSHWYIDATVIERGFPTERELALWRPAAKAESMLRGRPVEVLTWIDFVVNDLMRALSSKLHTGPPDDWILDFDGSAVFFPIAADDDGFVPPSTHSDEATP